MNSVKEIPETTTKSKKKAGMNKKDPMQGSERRQNKNKRRV
jgi:hypothetical protein